MANFKLFLVSAMLFTVCSATAQDINMVVDSVKSGLKAGSVKSAYNTVTDAFKVKRAEADSLVGTWVYCEPAVYATKGNVLFFKRSFSFGAAFRRSLALKKYNGLITYHDCGSGCLYFFPF